MAYVKDPNVITPKFTSVSSGSWMSSESSSFQGYLNEGYVALDQTLVAAGDCWCTQNYYLTGYILTYDTSGSTHKINYYNIYPQSFGNGIYLNRAPKNWTLYGTNDGGDTTHPIHSITNITGWQELEKKTFLLSSTAEYAGYYMSITLNNGSGINLSIGQLELCYDPALDGPTLYPHVI